MLAVISNPSSLRTPLPLLGESIENVPLFSTVTVLLHLPRLSDETGPETVSDPEFVSLPLIAASSHSTVWPPASFDLVPLFRLASSAVPSPSVPPEQGSLAVLQRTAACLL